MKWNTTRLLAAQSTNLLRTFAAQRMLGATFATIAVCCVLQTGASAELRFSVTPSFSDDASKTPLLILKDAQANIEAAIASKGGELCGLKVQHRGKSIETIYLARDYSPRKGWTGKAPLLWPATGRNFPPDLEARRKAGEQFNNGAYVLDGKRYEIPIHGFARAFPWKLVRTSGSAKQAAVELRFEDSPTTRKQYPFRFAVTVRYTLEDGVISIRYVVKSDDSNKRPMPFSVGNHITFNAPLVPGTKPGDMELVTRSKTELLKTSYGLPTGESRDRSHAAGIKLSKFERLSAVSLTGYKDKPEIIYRDPQGLAIRMWHSASHIPKQPVVLYNIWGDAKSGYFSPEPWVGLQNSLVLNKGLIRLKPGEEFDWTIWIEIERE